MKTCSWKNPEALWNFRKSEFQKNEKLISKIKNGFQKLKTESKNGKWIPKINNSCQTPNRLPSNKKNSRKTLGKPCTCVCEDGNLEEVVFKQLCKWKLLESITVRGVVVRCCDSRCVSQLVLVFQERKKMRPFWILKSDIQHPSSRTTLEQIYF